MDNAWDKLLKVLQDKGYTKAKKRLQKALTLLNDQEVMDAITEAVAEQFPTHEGIDHDQMVSDVFRHIFR